VYRVFEREEEIGKEETEEEEEARTQSEG